MHNCQLSMLYCSQLPWARVQPSHPFAFQLLWHYLEIMELEWDWLEEVVAALSWENPLWLDSRLVIDPLQKKKKKKKAVLSFSTDKDFDFCSVSILYLFAH